MVIRGAEAYRQFSSLSSSAHLWMGMGAFAFVGAVWSGAFWSARGDDGGSQTALVGGRVGRG